MEDFHLVGINLIWLKKTKVYENFCQSSGSYRYQCPGFHVTEAALITNHTSQVTLNCHQPHHPHYLGCLHGLAQSRVWYQECVLNGFDKTDSSANRREGHVTRTWHENSLERQTQPVLWGAAMHLTEAAPSWWQHESTLLSRVVSLQNDIKLWAVSPALTAWFPSGRDNFAWVVYFW